MAIPRGKYATAAADAVKEGLKEQRKWAGRSIPMTSARSAAAEARAVKAAGTADAQGNMTKKNYGIMESGYAERDAANRTSRDLQRLMGKKSGSFETGINKPSASVQAMMRKKK